MSAGDAYRENREVYLELAKVASQSHQRERARYWFRQAGIALDCAIRLDKLDELYRLGKSVDKLSPCQTFANQAQKSPGYAGLACLTRDTRAEVAAPEGIRVAGAFIHAP
jgi:hypothetical protein